MRRFKIIEIGEFNTYIIKDDITSKSLSIMLEFYGVDAKIGDFLSIDERLLNTNFDGYSQPYAFEVVSKICDGADFAILENSSEIYPLRRIYG